MSPPPRRRNLVRPYVITGGRAEPTRNTHRLSTTTTLTGTRDRPVTGLGPERTSVVELCHHGYLTVAEIAGRLGLPLTITRVLIGDLLDSDHLVIREQPPITDTELLEKVLRGLQEAI